MDSRCLAAVKSEHETLQNAKKTSGRLSMPPEVALTLPRKLSADCVFAALARTNADYFIDIGHENLAVADFAGVR